MRDSKATRRNTEVVLGEDWVTTPSSVDDELREGRKRRSLIAVNRSPLARKIIIFNLLGLVVLVGGVLFLNPFRESLLHQREQSLVMAVEIVADVFEVQQKVPVQAGGPGGTGLTPEGVAASLEDIEVRDGSEVLVFAPDGALLGRSGPAGASLPVLGLEREQSNTLITDGLARVWEVIAGLVAAETHPGAGQNDTTEAKVRTLLGAVFDGNTQISRVSAAYGESAYLAASPVIVDGEVLGAVALSSPGGLVDTLVRAEREQILQVFVIAILVSIGLSLVLASTIANPLADLAAAAEIGRDKNSRRMNPGRVRIPDLTARPDEIGRLSKALRGMVAALYDRIDANEQFAADVAHEIKNPLASLRSAIGSLRFVKKEEQREKLLDVIEHDVRRLDRLVSDISNASRLDSELVKEEEEAFDLIRMLRNLTEYLGGEAHQKGVDFITDLAAESIVITGLEARLAQVFVNLITNAISFCEEGDAIRVWARQRESRVLIVVEDTGPGIPEEALVKIFNRFYSQRPENQFGNNSGLGLAISKQIVEAHGGVIWAENIRPTDADVTSEPLGARFVVGLPV